MQKSHNRKFDLPWIILHPGDYYASRANEVISTVLGSCVAVVLHDRQAQVSGMNHFMLPGIRASEKLYQEESGRYGAYAMDLLINTMVKQGAARSRLEAKVFGGGHVLSRATGREHQHFSGKGQAQPAFNYDTSGKSVPESNIHFALEYLRVEGIALHGHDLGGSHGRKVYLFPTTGKVLLSMISSSLSIESVASEETAYLRKVTSEVAKKKKDDGIVLF